MTPPKNVNKKLSPENDSTRKEKQEKQITEYGKSIIELEESNSGIFTTHTFTQLRKSSNKEMRENVKGGKMVIVENEQYAQYIHVPSVTKSVRNINMGSGGTFDKERTPGCSGISQISDSGKLDNIECDIKQNSISRISLVGGETPFRSTEASKPETNKPSTSTGKRVKTNVNDQLTSIMHLFSEELSSGASSHGYSAASQTADAVEVESMQYNINQPSTSSTYLTGIGKSSEEYRSIKPIQSKVEGDVECYNKPSTSDANPRRSEKYSEDTLSRSTKASKIKVQGNFEHEINQSSTSGTNQSCIKESDGNTSTKPRFYNREMLWELQDIDNVTEMSTEDIYHEYGRRTVESRQDQYRNFFHCDSSKEPSPKVSKEKKRGLSEVEKSEEATKTETGKTSIGTRKRETTTDSKIPRPARKPRDASSIESYAEKSNDDDDINDGTLTLNELLSPANATIHTCKFCFKTFTSKISCDEHVRLHTGDRLRCSKCGATFVGKQELKKHEKTHEEKVMYKCDVCQKEYSYRTELGRHRIEHREGRVGCKICLKTFTRLAGLESHMKDKHPETEK